jgi:phosphomethylpyrimidine synthase
VIASKIAGHAADIARGLKGADVADRKISIARTDLNWKGQLAESLDPATAEEIHLQSCKDIGVESDKSADYCSMCGEQWCSVRTNKEIRAMNT